VHPDGSLVAIGAPDALEEFLAREDPPRVFGQQSQQGELAGVAGTTPAVQAGVITKGPAMNRARWSRIAPAVSVAVAAALASCSPSSSGHPGETAGQIQGHPPGQGHLHLRYHRAHRVHRGRQRGGPRARHLMAPPPPSPGSAAQRWPATWPPSTSPASPA
jgi:hypothetical protein